MKKKKMTIREFNCLEEIQKYYDKKTNTYIFIENKGYIDLVIFNFDLKVDSNIRAYDIRAENIDALNIDAVDINARDITARNIDAWNINARNINYYGVCFAYENIKCKSIKGRRENARHYALDGELEVEENVD